MVVHRDRIIAGVVVLLVFVTISLPYIYGWRSAGADFQFNGFLLNPQDGNSYLAKMYQGYRGDIRFTLPYTAEKGNGAYIFLFYLLLGHLARLFSLPLVATFHVARVISAFLMYICLYRFLTHAFDQLHIRLFAFILAVIGSGMGWIALVFGKFTSDFWVAEAYPFLSAFSNPHFPLGLAFVLILFTFTKGRQSGLLNWLGALFSLCLAIILPFGVVLVLVILAGLVLWELFPSYSQLIRSPVFQRLVWIGLGGIPVLFYYVLVTNQDPLLRVWNSQNQTPSPPLWDLFVSLCPVIILAVVGIGLNFKRQDRLIRLLITWTILGLLLLYIPWDLQRRFMLGYYIPVCALAAAGLGAIVKRPGSYVIAAALLTILAIPTNLVIGMSTFHAINTHDSRIYLSAGEAEAFEWIASHTHSDSTILAAPDTGLYIPAYTGMRVLYGHPYETVDAILQRGRVAGFFDGKATTAEEGELLAEVDYVFVGPRETLLGGYTPSPYLELAYTTRGVRIFRVTDH
jgi:hypothetical protein